MKPPSLIPRLVPWLFGASAFLSLTPPLWAGPGLTPVGAAAAAASGLNPPGTLEVYGGTVCEYPTGSDGAGAPRVGSVQLQIVDGFVSGRLVFYTAAADGTTIDCRGYLDPATSRGYLKLLDATAPDGGGMNEKLAVLLRQGVLTGGTLRADGRVLAFRLERFLVVRP